MKRNFHRIAVAAATALACAASPAFAQSGIMSAETANVGANSHIVTVLLSKFAKRDGIEIQVNAGKTLTKAMLKTGLGQIDFATGVPALVGIMSAGKGPYKNQPDDAKRAAEDIRSMFRFVAGVYHPFAYADSGVEKWEDLKGRKVLTGPPGGAATIYSESVIKVMTGLEPGEDYEAVHVGWGVFSQTIRDRRVDAAIYPEPVGSANIEQLGVGGKFNILPIPDSVFESAEMREVLSAPGRGVDILPANSYAAQVNNGADLRLPAYTFFQGVRKDLGAEVVYKVTRAFWENLDEVHATSPLVAGITPETALDGLNVPLHAGALRYYREAGFEVPDNLIPPEAR